MQHYLVGVMGTDQVVDEHSQGIQGVMCDLLYALVAVGVCVVEQLLGNAFSVAAGGVVQVGHGLLGVCPLDGLD